MDSAPDTPLRKITVAAATRRRPNMLANLVASWAALERPAGVETRFVIVENDDTPNTQALVEDLARRHPGLILDYVLEPEIGIPFARNAAARHAVAAGADWLMFVDDDEVVAPDWLVRFTAAMDRTDAVLLGAPLRVHDRFHGKGVLERVMHDNLVRRYQRVERRATRRASLGATPGVTIVTNNWAARTRVFTEAGIWFDESLRHTGGSDAQFCADVKARGLPTGWVADALVFEDIPRERLSIGYQYRRGREQSMAHFRRKLAKNPRRRFQLLLFVPLRIVAAAVIGVSVPLTGGRTLLPCCRAMGRVTGQLQAAFGRDSRLYFEVTGN